MFPLLILQTWKGKMDVISFFPLLVIFLQSSLVAA